MAKTRRHLGEILYKAGVVPKHSLINAIKTSKATNRRLGEVLLELGLVDEETLMKALAKQFDMKYVNLDHTQIPPEALKLLPEETLRKHNVLPLGMNNGRMRLVISDPSNLDAMDAIRFRLNTELECYLASANKIRLRIDEAFSSMANEEDDRLRHSIDATAAELAETGHELRAELLRGVGGGNDDEGPVIRLVNLIIDNAYYMRASDIHVEPMTDRVRIRYRVDGVCLEKDNIPKNMQAPLITRLKILSGMDIAERRLPQDGRIKRNIGGQDIDFRVSALPAYRRHDSTCRLLSRPHRSHPPRQSPLPAPDRGHRPADRRAGVRAV